MHYLALPPGIDISKQYLANVPGHEHFLAKDPPPPRHEHFLAYQREVCNRYSNCLLVRFYCCYFLQTELNNPEPLLEAASQEQIQVSPLQILEELCDVNSLFEEESEKSNSEMCCFWVDTPNDSKTKPLYTQFWEEDFLTDLTLIVGPDKATIRVHRLVLAARLEYFKAMFSVGLNESSAQEVSLPFLGFDDMNLVLKYAYSGEANVTKENVFKMALLANYFGSDDLLNICCNFVKRFTNLNNCIKLFKLADQLNIMQLRENCFLFIVDHLSKINIDDLSALPVDVLLEIIKHPAALLCREDRETNEKQMFELLWNKVKSLPNELRTYYIPKILQAIHLPIIMDKCFFFFLLKEFKHIPEAKDLIMKAGEKIDPAETREWYLSRYKDAVRLQILTQERFIEVNGNKTNEYSPCVLMKGFPFFMYVIPCEEKGDKDIGDKVYHIESPVSIEHLGLPYKVIVEVKNKYGNYIPVNTYLKDKVEQIPIDASYKDKNGWFNFRVTLKPL